MLASNPNAIGSVVSPFGGSLPCTTVAFTNADLVAGVLTFNHGLGDQFPVVQVYDDANQLVVPDSVTGTDVVTSDIDLTSFGAIAGTWHVKAVGCP